MRFQRHRPAFASARPGGRRAVSAGRRAPAMVARTSARTPSPSPQTDDAALVPVCSDDPRTDAAVHAARSSRRDHGRRQRDPCPRSAGDHERRSRSRRRSLDAETLMLVRIAALVAVDAPAGVVHHEPRRDVRTPASMSRRCAACWSAGRALSWARPASPRQRATSCARSRSSSRWRISSPRTATERRARIRGRSPPSGLHAHPTCADRSSGTGDDRAPLDGFHARKPSAIPESEGPCPPHIRP